VLCEIGGDEALSSRHGRGAAAGGVFALVVDEGGRAKPRTYPTGRREAVAVARKDVATVDGVQEYAVFHDGRRGQIDSLSVSWMTKASLEKAIVRCSAESELFDAAAVPNLLHPAGACRSARPA